MNRRKKCEEATFAASATIQWEAYYTLILLIPPAQAKEQPAWWGSL